MPLTKAAVVPVFEEWRAAAMRAAGRNERTKKKMGLSMNSRSVFRWGAAAAGDGRGQSAERTVAMLVAVFVLVMVGEVSGRSIFYCLSGRR